HARAAPGDDGARGAVERADADVDGSRVAGGSTVSGEAFAIDARELVGDMNDVLDEIVENGGDLTIATTSIGEEGVKRQKAAIDAGLEPPLSPRYAKQKAADGYGGRAVLVRTGAGRDSISHTPSKLQSEIGPTDPKM